MYFTNGACPLVPEKIRLVVFYKIDDSVFQDVRSGSLMAALEIPGNRWLLEA